MMRAGLFVLLFAGAACAHLPTLAPMAEAQKSATVARCLASFPRQPWRATHAIFATLPFGQQSQLVGVTATGPDGLHAVLLSPEGLALFDGTQRRPGAAGPPLAVRRAVPPFDRPAFAASLIADVGTVFLAPAGAPTEVGTYLTGESVCRWVLPPSEATEVILGPAGTRSLRTYRNLHLGRHVDFLGAADNGFFPEVRLVVPGAGGYTLEMRLVDHE